MTEEPKKISFGFSKVSKKNSLIQPQKQNEPNNGIQFIDCLEGKSIKLVSDNEEKKKELPIIPMRNGNALKESIIEVIKSRSQKKLDKECENSTIQEDETVVKTEPLSLDELATKEILEDLKKVQDQKKEELAPSVPLSSQLSLGKKESTLEDYETMPISDFGLAMLRGMGWDPKKGIGLNEKIVTPSELSLRPKGMGLGADKVLNAKNVSSNGEQLIMKKGAAVKILSGPYNNLYGKIEGFDELPGRLIVKIAANNIIVSLNEIMVQLVSLKEFNKIVENNENTQTKTEKSRILLGDFEQDTKSNVKHKQNDKRESKERENLNGREQIEINLRKKDRHKRRDDKSSHSGSDENVNSKKYRRKEERSRFCNEDNEFVQRKEQRRYSSSESSSGYKEKETAKKKKNYYKSRQEERYSKDNRNVYIKRSHYRSRKKYSSGGKRRDSSSSSERNYKKKANRRNRSESSESSDTSYRYKNIKHSRQQKNYYRR